MIPVLPEKEGVNDPTVTVCVPSASLSRYVSFETSLSALFVPIGSDEVRIQSASPARNRNEAVRRNVTEYYYFIDDDQMFNSNILISLMAHRLPIVAAFTILKAPPFLPVIFKGEDRLPDGTRRATTFTFKELDNKTGLLPVWAVGGTGLLVQREVFTRIPAPWFELGRFNPEECGEDLSFCEKVREAGYPIFVDLDARQGHLSPVAAWPDKLADGTWTVRLMWESGHSILLARTDLGHTVADLHRLAPEVQENAGPEAPHGVII